MFTNKKIYSAHMILCVIVTYFVLYSSTNGNDTAFVIQSLEISPYTEVKNGFQSVFKSKFNTFILSQYNYNTNENKQLHEKFNKIQPKLVFTIGENAFLEMQKEKSTPTIFSMVLYPETFLSTNLNSYCISMLPEPAEQIRIIKNLMPHIRSIGIITSTLLSESTINQYINASKLFEVEICQKIISGPTQYLYAISNFEKPLDAFLMIPDSSIITPETIEILMLWSIKYRVPVISFSEKYLKVGALMSMSLTPFEMGVQAGIVANNIMIRNGFPNDRIIYSQNIQIDINQKVAKKLNMILNIGKVKNVTLK